ncbi:uncharacterized protein LOC120271531 [Dioscorea cayenensis subsp. rotundata]|uniref:Uncharacterized protein LOC120271531 n=1 Tax=Dioscorea cayennensis subsp. rotundata TaxID=55577 RepID=A0AB40C310_DIOCR|nr:uncharacterized protein LOC120271531 [Dioscorea cayenensis subsp. rotundata]
MALVLRYMNNRGYIVERFLAIVHVSDTTALSLKEAIESIFSNHGLSLSRLCGQGYDGANMRVVTNNEGSIASLFQNVGCLLNVVGASCKRYDILRESQAARVAEALKNDELASGKGLNQEISLKRASDTRWGSHYGTLLNLIILFLSVIDVLKMLVELFNVVIDRQLQELNNHFSVINTELLLCAACLSPAVKVMGLDSQLETYIIDMCSNPEFLGIKEIGQLAEKLASILPVATASVEMTFLAMKIVENQLRNHMGYNLMTDCLVTYIEIDIFNNIDNETIIQRFQNIKSRRGQL